MFCTLCGHKVEENQKFCQECGHSLAGITDRTEAIAVTTSPEAPADLPAALSEDLVTDPNSTETGIDTAVRTDADAMTEHHELPDIADFPTRQMNAQPPIPDPDWAIPTSDVAPTPIAAPALDTAPPVEAPTIVTPAAPMADVLATTQIPTQQFDGDSTTAFDAMPGNTTDEVPAIFDGSDDIHEYPHGRDPFKVKLVFILAFFGAIAVLMSAVADIVDIRTSAPVDGIATGVRTLDTLGTNLAVAGFFGATVMALGGLLACFGFRWGAGLAGGAGLALAGWSAIVAGLAELRIASAESITRQTTDIAFTLKVTRDLGFWLIVAVAAIGLLVFLASLRSFGTGGRPALNPWIAALGAVAGVVLIAGPLLPEGNANFANNFRSASPVFDLPTVYFAGRMIQLALIGGAVVFGLLIVRAYGLGLAAGGVSVALWMWLSSLLDMGTFPLGIAAGNFGASDVTPHAVTTVGMALTLLMLVVAAVLAIVGHLRQLRSY